MSQLIGLVGYAGAGKDTVGSILLENHGFQRRAFADKLRELALAMDFVWGPEAQRLSLSGIVEDYGWDYAKRNYPEVRRFLQDIGQGHRRVFGEDFWVRQILGRTDSRLHWILGPATVITDVRYENEAQRILQLGGHLIVIARRGCGPNSHLSEGYAEWIHRYEHSLVCNDSTIEDLATSVEAVVDAIARL